MTDVELVYQMLLENGIKCELHQGRDETVQLIINKEKPFLFSENKYVRNVRRWIFGVVNGSTTPNIRSCARPDISDPDFIEKVKEFVKFCRKQTDCGRCPDYRLQG